MTNNRIILLKPFLFLVVWAYLLMAMVGCGEGDNKPDYVYQTTVPTGLKSTIIVNHNGANSDSTIRFLGLSYFGGTDSCQNLGEDTEFVPWISPWGDNLLFSPLDKGDSQTIYTSNCGIAALLPTVNPIHNFYYCVKTNTHVYSSVNRTEFECGETYTFNF